jgi:hypothetical protein
MTIFMKLISEHQHYEYKKYFVSKRHQNLAIKGERRTEIYLGPQVKYAFNRADFRELHNF